MYCYRRQKAPAVPVPHMPPSDFSTAGTIMANTKLPLAKWFLALYFAATNKDGISEMAVAKYVGVTLKTAWALLHKIRSAMGERESLYRLGGKAAGKRGRGNENKTEVAVALQLGSDGHPQFLKMQVIADTKSSTLLAFSKDNITVATPSTVMHSSLTMRFLETTVVTCRNTTQKAMTDD